MLTAQPSPSIPRHHQALIFSFAPSSGARSLHCAIVGRYFPGFVLPSGINSQHCAAIGYFFQALRRRLAPIFSIAPTLGASFMHCTNWCSSKYHCWTNRCSSKHPSRRQAHTIVCANGRSACHRSCRQALSISPFTPTSTYNCSRWWALRFLCCVDKFSSEYCSLQCTHTIVWIQPSVLLSSITPAIKCVKWKLWALNST